MPFLNDIDPLTPANPTALVLGVQGGKSHLFPFSVTAVGTGAIARTVAAKLGESVSVKDFGAVGDGTTDDTVAFASALAASKSVYVLPGRKYVVGDLVVPSCAYLWSDSARQEAANNTLVAAPWLLAKAGCTRVLNVDGTTGVYIGGLCIDGLTGTPDGISAGSTLMTLERVLATRCSHGLGGAVGAGSAYTSIANIHLCTFRNNVYGVMNLIDSLMLGGALTANQYGLELGAGAIANNFTGVRIEWNTIYGADLFTAGLNTFTGGLFDRNFYAGARVYQTTAPVTFAGTLFRRNGRNNVSNQDAHIILDGTTGAVVLSGIGTQTGKDDDGTGANTPAYSVRYVNTNAAVMITGSITGYITAATTGSAPTSLQTLLV